jgi:flavodoxin
MQTDMTALVLYDSRYGNTEKIAEAIGAGIGGAAPVQAINQVDAAALPKVDLLVVGCPTHGGRPTESLQAWLGRIPAEKLANVKVAAFDTRLPAADQGFALRALIGIIGFAAPRILKRLKSSGGIAFKEAEGFIVEGKEGPLRGGELERASQWGRALAGS